MSKFEGNAITWFEIPASDIHRAVSFYETMLDAKLTQFPSEDACYMFPANPGSVAGALIQRADATPAGSGTTVYLNVDGKLDASLKRAEKLNAKILVPRTEIPGGYGYYACVQDSEGNHVGLHSQIF